MNKAILLLFFKENEGVELAVQELTALAEAAGAEVAGHLVQIKSSIDAATYVGKGKAEEARAMVEANDCDLVIFNDELSGSQIRNLEEAIGVRIVDRTLLILDIFAERAQTMIAKLQVELARQRYKLPRLIGFGGELSRTGAAGGSGGVRVGTRGAGEQKLELDRRAISRRIAELERQIEEAEQDRVVQRSKRERNEVPVVALVGYTNAGKSSVMNYILKATGQDVEKQVFEKDMLFATLDTYSRRIQFDDKSIIILVDTVGFVSKLPHSLVRAFRSTLEESALADLLVQVVDTANTDREFQMNVTADVLKTIGAGAIPMITAFNKVDLVDEPFYKGEDAVAISSKTGEGMDVLIDMIREKLFGSRKEVLLLIPFDKGSDASYIQNKYNAEVEYVAEGSKIKVRLDDADAGRFHTYVVEEAK